jgi:hypothetical protein
MVTALVREEGACVGPRTTFRWWGLTAVVLQTLLGCSSSSSGGVSVPACVLQGDTYDCGGTSYPACTVEQSYASCVPDAAVTCVSCIQGAGSSCSCDTGPDTSKPDAGPFWLCAGTGHTCQ